MHGQSAAELNEFGQSVWLDFVSRDLLKSGGLATADRSEDGLRGVTSNPSIFEKAIGHGDDYDALDRRSRRSLRRLDPGALFEDLAVRDIQEGADTAATRLRADAAARRLHQPRGFALSGDEHRTRRSRRRAVCGATVNRPNLMVKVPGTKPGLPPSAR